MPYIVRGTDGRTTSRRAFATLAKAENAARQSAKQTRQPRQVWWINDAGIPKVLLTTVDTGAGCDRTHAGWVHAHYGEAP